MGKKQKNLRIFVKNSHGFHLFLIVSLILNFLLKEIIYRNCIYPLSHFGKTVFSQS